MRNVLPEWYSPDGGVIYSILTAGTIALDANVLLDLYRLGADERQQILDVFAKGGVRERLWLPYQAAFEYQKNRVKVATDHVKQYDDIREALAKSESSVLAEVGMLRDKSVKAKLEKIVRESLPAAIEQVTDEIERLQSQNTISLEHSASDDEIREKIDALFIDEGQIGQKPSEEDIADRMATVDQRYEDKVPPGYKDASKREGREGDLLVWYEILAYAEKSDRPLLYVTSDTKEDWYERVGGKTAGPRRELRVEMMKKTENFYHQVSLNRFLELANEHLSANVETDTIQVVDEINEQRRAESNLLSELHHPMIVAELDNALATLRPATANYQHVFRVKEMLNGERPFDPVSAQAALVILQELSAKGRARIKRARRNELSRQQRTEDRAREIRNMLVHYPAESLKVLGSSGGKLDELIELSKNDPEIITLLAEEMARIEDENRYGPRQARMSRADALVDDEELIEPNISDVRPG
ncbi:PIN-like domain-containing protein [Rhodococcus sp. IEGM 1307]|uniref:PIN-like domain-containing protein n=1 Tax=Rhodococcus sp. IEGM 1307 TaxID=3047091 RepID=UPI0024B707AF|nr:PIN-like domain-containing protein [Rhodococcus sp. IEGM 1307]MDI9980055.1 PIN-like domain-containing protein [Rhodococcus sp. IEGM 1307]